MPPAIARRTLLVALAAVVAACAPAPSATPAPTVAGSLPGSTPAATPAASVDAAAVYEAIATQVEVIRGLQPKAPIAPVLLDADQLRANLTASFDKDNPASVIRETEDLYRLLGLLPGGASLRAAELDLLSGQVAGYYSPDQKALFVISRAGGIGPTQRVTYAHEFTHQLQDQNFDLTTVRGTATDQSDQGLARLALIEGDAISVQTAWTAANLTSADLAQLLADATDPAVIASLQRAPAILRILSLAPYTEGQAFVAALQATGGEAAVNAAFAQPPASTSQVLHPEIFRQRLAPAAVALPGHLAASLGAGWTSLGQDTIGELFIRSWLQAAGVSPAAAAIAAAGWAGDRIELFAGPNGQAAVAMVIRWTSEPEVVELGSSWPTAATAIPTAYLYDGSLRPATVAIVIAPDAALAQALDTALRR
jgi:hypothetical protein